MKMTAAVLFEQGLPRPYADSQPLKITQVELDPPGQGEVLVKVEAAGLCHSDLSTIANNLPRKLPMVPGHEGAGVVVETGPGVTDLIAGDHVVFIFMPGCGHCRNCRRGRPHICLTWPALRSRGELPTGGQRLSLGEQRLAHNSGISCFAEYAVIATASLVKVDPSLSMQDAALFGCAIQTGVGAVINTAGVQPGDAVAIIGMGGVGLSCLLGAKHAGAEQIVAIDLAEDKLKLAADLGATTTYNAADPDCAKSIRKLTAGGVDYAFEMAGAEPAVKLAYKILVPGGTVICAGIPKANATFTTYHGAMVGEEKSIQGCVMGSCVAHRDIPMFINMYQSGQLPVNRLQSGTLKLEDINTGFDALADASAVRQIITF